MYLLSNMAKFFEGIYVRFIEIFWCSFVFFDALFFLVLLWNPKWSLFESTNFPAQRKQKPRQRQIVHEFIAACLWEMISLPKDPWIGGTPPSHNLLKGILDWAWQKIGVLEIPGRSVKTISKKEILYLSIYIHEVQDLFDPTKLLCLLIIEDLRATNLQNTQPSLQGRFVSVFWRGRSHHTFSGAQSHQWNVTPEKSGELFLQPQGWTI